MNVFARLVPAALILVSISGSQLAYSQTASLQKTRPSTVSGSVTIKGKPVAGITVALRRSESGSTGVAIRGTTNHDGIYRIVNVPAGTYEMVVVAPAFVVVDQGMQRGRTVLVNEDETIDGIDFALVRGGVITGRVTDADGKPVIRQRVEIYRADAWDQTVNNRQGQRVFVTAGATTDDRGIYRVFGLVSGRYKVAIGRDEDVVSGPQMVGRPIYSRVFHPDIPDQSRATIIEVTEGSETSNVDISLGRPVETYSVSGQVIEGEESSPLPGIRLALERIAAGTQTYSNFASVNPQGEFHFEGVAPGKYVVTLITERGSERFLDRTPVEVAEGNITGLILKLTRGASISGLITLETENRAAMTKLRQAEVQIHVIWPGGGAGRGGTSIIAADGSFRVGGLPAGTARFIVTGGRTSPAALKNFTISRIERDGIIQPQAYIDIRDGEQATGIRLVMSYADGSLHGIVKVENGILPPGRLVVRLTRAGDLSQSVGFAQIDQRGHFLIQGLPTGLYEVHLTIQFPNRPARTIKQQVSVTAGATSEMTIVIDAETQRTP